MGVLRGKTALVTGAGQGVGQGVAFALAAEGAQVMLVGRTAEKLRSTQGEIAARGGASEIFVGDIKEEPTIAKCVDATVDRFGGLDILVNNAQEVVLGELRALCREDLDRGWLSGPVAALAFMQRAYPHLEGGGVVINMATPGALRPDYGGYGGYFAVKEAMRCLSRAAACEWGPAGIRVLSVMPRAATPAYASWAEASPEEAAQWAAGVPLGYLGDAEHDLGRVIVFLCGADARYLTGSTLVVDGGNTHLR